MTKGELWDDSALTHAFDQAMSNFKKKHVKGYEESSSGAAEVKDTLRNSDASSSVGRDIGGGHLHNTVVGEGDGLSAVNENEILESHQVPQEYAEMPNVTQLQNQAESYSASQGQEEYDLLLKQYYEAEEKRTQIWEKLQQYSNWDYTSYPATMSGACTLSSTVPASQDQYNTSQACYPAYAVVCCSNGCQSSTTTCCLPSCSLGTSAGLCMNNSVAAGSGLMSEDVDIVKKGMEAAKKAMSKLKEQASDCQLEDQSCSQREPMINGESDLTDVLNAWYSAGFYTAKYLTEKSHTKHPPSGS